MEHGQPLTLSAFVGDEVAAYLSHLLALWFSLPGSLLPNDAGSTSVPVSFFLQVSGRAERLAFAASFTPCYLTRLLYISGTQYPIQGAIRCAGLRRLTKRCPIQGAIRCAGLRRLTKRSPIQGALRCAGLRRLTELYPIQGAIQCARQCSLLWLSEFSPAELQGECL